MTGYARLVDTDSVESDREFRPGVGKLPIKGPGSKSSRFENHMVSVTSTQVGPCSIITVKYDIN